MNIAAIIAARCAALTAPLLLGAAALHAQPNTQPAHPANTQAAPPATTAPTATPASAPTVGHVVQGIGAAFVGGQPARPGQAVQQGQVLSTGPDGFLYVQTPDHGLLVLRPHSALRIEHYHIDPLHPAQSRFRLQHLRGTVRSVSGQAVPAARQQFRFNTPVAAIGLVGTDFTVFTTDTLSRVSVASGAVQVSGFGNGCLPEAFGPCAGAHASVLQANQPGQVLQVQRGQLQPQLLHAPLEPNPGTSNNSNSSGTATSTNASSASTNTPGASPPEASAASPAAAAQRLLPQASLVPAPAAAPLGPPPLLWGRWQALAASPAHPPASTELERARQAGYHLLGLTEHFTLLRHPAHGWVPRSHGALHFGLHSYQALVHSAAGQASAASISHASLMFDFTQQRFTTRFLLDAPGLQPQPMLGTGALDASGRFDGIARLFDGSNLHVSGALAQPVGGPAQAAYIFTSAPLPGGQRASGATFWQH